MKRRTSSKPQSIRAKRSGKRAARTSRSRRVPVNKRQIDFVDSLIAASAQALGLTIDPAWHDGVKFHLQLLFNHASRVDEFPLADDSEPAPVFHA